MSSAMKSSQSAVLPDSSLTRQAGGAPQPTGQGTAPTTSPPTHSHPAMVSTNSIASQQLATSTGPEAMSSGKKSSSFNVLNKAAPLFKVSMPSLVPSSSPASASTRPPLTSDIDALLSIEANTSSSDAAAAAAAGQPSPTSSPLVQQQARPRGVSQLVAAKFKHAASPGHSSPQVSPFQRSVSTKSAKRPTVSTTAAPDVVPAPSDDQYIPEPHLPHLRHGRKNMDIDSIMAEAEERARAGSAPISHPPHADNGTRHPGQLSPMRDRSGSKRSFRRWSMPGLTNQTRDPNDASSVVPSKEAAAGSRPTSSGLTARIGQLASTITSPLRRRHRSMQELSTPRMHAAPMLSAAEGASMRDLPLPMPIDIDELLTRFGTSDSHLVRGKAAAARASINQIAAKTKATSETPHPDSLVVVRTSPVSRHMSTSSGPPIRVPGDDTSSIRPLRRPSRTDNTEDSSVGALVNSNEAVHRAGNLLASSGASTPTSLSAFSSNDRMSVQAMYANTIPRGPGSETDAHHASSSTAPTMGGGVSVAPNVATIAETSQVVLPTANANALSVDRRQSAAESRVSDVSSIASVDVDMSNARAIEALRAMPRPVLDKVYVHHCNDFDAVVTPSEGPRDGE